MLSISYIQIPSTSLMCILLAQSHKWRIHDEFRSKCVYYYCIILFSALCARKEKKESTKVCHSHVP